MPHTEEYRDIYNIQLSSVCFRIYLLYICRCRSLPYTHTHERAYNMNHPALAQSQILLWEKGEPEVRTKRTEHARERQRRKKEAQQQQARDAQTLMIEANAEWHRNKGLFWPTNSNGWTSVVCMMPVRLRELRYAYVCVCVSVYTLQMVCGGWRICSRIAEQYILFASIQLARTNRESVLFLVFIIRRVHFNSQNDGENEGKVRPSQFLVVLARL